MVVVEFLVTDRQAEISDTLADDPSPDIEVVFVPPAAVEVTEPQALELGAAARHSLGRIEG